MAFSDQEKVRIRHHLGFLNVGQAYTFVAGTPAGVETQFLIEGAMQRVLPEAEVLARELLARCDSVEGQMMDNQDLLAVESVDEIKIRQDEFQALIKRYHYHRNGLANVLGIYPNPFDKRFSADGGGGINVNVMH